MKNLTLLTGLLLTLSLSACRFGNYVQPSQDKSSISKVLTLSLEAREFQTAVIYNDLDGNGDYNMDVNSNTPLLAIPSSVSQTFTNPVQLYFFTDPASDPVFYNDTYRLAQATHVTDQNEINAHGKGDAVPLWKNPDCHTHLEIYQEGKLNLNKTDTTDGRLNMALSVYRMIQGDCQADLKELAQCYLDKTSCTEATYEASLNLFDLYVNYGGILSLDDATLARIQALVYLVYFE